LNVVDSSTGRKCSEPTNMRRLTCTNGQLSGPKDWTSFRFSTCTARPMPGCNVIDKTKPGGYRTIPHGDTGEVFTSATAPSGSSCASVNKTAQCLNGRMWVDAVATALFTPFYSDCTDPAPVRPGGNANPNSDNGVKPPANNPVPDCGVDPETDEPILPDACANGHYVCPPEKCNEPPYGCGNGERGFREECEPGQAITNGWCDNFCTVKCYPGYSPRKTIWPFDGDKVICSQFGESPCGERINSCSEGEFDYSYVPDPLDPNHSWKCGSTICYERGFSL
jgi:hypothetical protein